MPAQRLFSTCLFSTRLFSTRRLLPFALLCVLAALSGCATEWDSAVVFPATYSSTYEKLHDCKASAHPAAKYVVTWMSPEAKDAMDALAALPAGSTETIAWPENAVFVKVQYDDSACSEVQSFTAMKKLAAGAATDAGDWKWQHVGADGECLNCDNGTACSGCHTQPACNGLVCTKRN